MADLIGLADQKTGSWFIQKQPTPGPKLWEEKRNSNQAKEEMN